MKHSFRKDDIKPICKNGFKNIKENPADSGIVPDGYLIGDEFEKKVNEKVNAYCKKSGVN